MNKAAALKNELILKALLGKDKGLNVRAISRETKFEIHQVKYYLYYLQSRGFVNFLNKENKLLKDGDFIELSSLGKFFVKDQGGFRKEHSDNLRQKRWLKVKITATVLYSLSILVVSICALISSNKSSSLEERLTDLEKSIMYRDKINNEQPQTTAKTKSVILTLEDTDTILDSQP
ncbi:MAG: hypothetical protein ACI91R_002291 [Vicingaceae bacterium]|jgi:hypothetical protein